MPSYGPDLRYHYEIIEMKGADIPELVGMPIEKIGLFALRENILVPIPFQFEERDQFGNTFFKQDSPIQGTLGIFDKNDALLVFAEDAGDAIDHIGKNHNRLIGEIAVTRHTKGKTEKQKFFYAATEPNRVFKSPVDFDIKSGTVRTPLYTLFTAPDNFLVWKGLSFVPYQKQEQQVQQNVLNQQEKKGGNSKSTPEIDKLSAVPDSLLDSLKIRMKANVLPFFIPITMSNDDIESRIVEVQPGIIRQVILVKSVVKVTGITVARMLLRFYVSPQDINLHVRTRIPPSLGKLIVNSRATISLDGNNLINSDVQTSLTENKQFQVDGIMSAAEKKIVNSIFDQNKIHWVALDTHKNFSLVAKIGLPKNLGIDIKLLYVDDKNDADAPENFPGQLPNIGFSLSDIPENKDFDFFINLTFVDSLNNMTINDLASVLNQPTTVQFKRKEVMQAALQHRTWAH